MPGITDLERNIARLEEATAAAREATREAHEARKDLDKKKREIDAWGKEKAGALVEGIVRKECDRQFEELTHAVNESKRFLDAAIEKFVAEIVDLCVGPKGSSEDLRPLLGEALAHRIADEMAEFLENQIVGRG